MWLHEEEKTRKGLKTLLERLQEAQEELSAVFEQSFGSTQTQATCYPGAGSHYARHLDASKSKAQKRLLTFVWYANAADGGNLR
jgi:Rps23 Pro-64 3,4-dihydroxylase Tpa1-like proline 4-hydroxylase